MAHALVEPAENEGLHDPSEHEVFLRIGMKRQRGPALRLSGQPDREAFVPPPASRSGGVFGMADPHHAPAGADPARVTAFRQAAPARMGDAAAPGDQPLDGSVVEPGLPVRLGHGEVAGDPGAYDDRQPDDHRDNEDTHSFLTELVGRQARELALHCSRRWAVCFITQR
ncbi:hypothetical protein [Chthonobacter rhizosphaerae]|uniref:hypothetical protein n=1 Tax=Chthonobacter rhizosphaerae TaxID=2735553 RepID=UPI0015EFD864|nr:hypothetical protein [Chthonobacter rhizosphaerae]